MINTNTVIGLERAERYAEAGYGHLFAYNKRNFNATIDARTKAKYVKSLNPDTYHETQNEVVYSGPTVFFRPDIWIQDSKIDKLDIKSAYLAYLVNEKIKKPGIFRIKYRGAYRHSDRVVLYIVKFDCHINNLFVKWFLNSSAIHKKKFRTNGQRITGEVGIFSSTWMNNLKYVNMFLDTEEAIITKSYIFVGKDTVECTKEQIHKLYKRKEVGYKTAKMMLVQSTGWLSIIDRPTYYHMIQYIKFYLLETVYKNGLGDDTFGVQTDCIFYRVTEENKDIYQDLLDHWSVAQKQSTIGNFTHERVNYEDVITNKARVVLT